ncbi:helix-turn-helix domain-containing protein [Enterococcus sp. DIV1420a]|uniref:helix-turn-helix domain-containing protein n=1 Tax=Enterococcus TaxID=1350 RepID=UPI003F2073F3
MNYFKVMRKREKMTQREMASRLNISHSHYSKLEGGFVKPSFDVIERLYNVFSDVDTNEFFK